MGHKQFQNLICNFTRSESPSEFFFSAVTYINKSFENDSKV
jgi:hypothetical protein